MHHPWRAFRLLVDWTLEWSHHLPEDVMGYTDFVAKRVVLAHGLTQAERRCTIAHETEHIRRGSPHAMTMAREEVVIDRNVARRLLPDVRAIGEALAWAHSLDEAADELWVDEDTLRARLRHLHPAERHYLRNRLTDC